MLKRENITIGVSPIMWTNADMPELGGHIPFEECVDQMREAGFEVCESGPKFPKTPERINRELGKRNLRVISEWFPTFLTSEPYEVTINRCEEQIERLKILEGNIIMASEQGNSIQCKELPIFGQDKPVFNEKEWRILIKAYNEMGEMARDSGMYFAVHHHMGTGFQTESEIDRLMEETDPELVFLTYDTGHIVCAGGSPEKILKKYIGRVRHIHLKDVRRGIFEKAKETGWSFLNAVKEGIFTVPGDGSIDYVEVVKLISDSDYKGCLLIEAEQDPDKAPPMEYALQARKFIRDNFGF